MAGRHGEAATSGGAEIDYKPSVSDDDTVLRCEHLFKHFGGVTALDDVSLRIHPAEVTALIGPNGAGKTTLFNCLAGAMTPDGGTVWFSGLRIDGLKPAAVARLGLVRTFQNLRMFEGLTAYESVLAGASWREVAGSTAASHLGLGHERRVIAREALAIVGLENRADIQSSRLALAEQRRLEIARALATGPRVLLLDEPAAGTTAREAEELADLIKALVTDRALTVVVIEHTMSFVMRVAGVVHVLNFGHLIRSGSPAAIAGDKEIHKIYFGSREQ